MNANKNPIMNERDFTDWLPAQIREYNFMSANNLKTQNQARSFREKYGVNIINNEWNKFSNKIGEQKNVESVHINQRTKTNLLYNKAEILAYNKKISTPEAIKYCKDLRMNSDLIYRKCTPNSPSYNLNYSISDNDLVDVLYRQ